MYIWNPIITHRKKSTLTMTKMVVASMLSSAVKAKKCQCCEAAGRHRDEKMKMAAI
jgi:hypothetical protein